MSVQQPSWEQKKKERKSTCKRFVFTRHLLQHIPSRRSFFFRSSSPYLNLPPFSPGSFFFPPKQKKKRLLIACNIRDSLFFLLPCVVTLLPFLKIVFRLGSNFYFIFCFSLLPAAFRRRNIFCVYLSSHCKDAMSFLKGILLLPPAVTSLVLFHCPNAILLPVRNSSSTAVVVVVSVEYI